MGSVSCVILLILFLILFSEALDLTFYFNVFLAFAVGSITMTILDTVLPHLELGKKEDCIIKSKQLQSGLLILIGITIYNIPEGVLSSTGYSLQPQLGLLIAVAVFFHNMPECIATAILLISAGDKEKRCNSSKSYFRFSKTTWSTSGRDLTCQHIG